jgi:hypothetical protein
LEGTGNPAHAKQDDKNLVIVKNGCFLPIEFRTDLSHLETSKNRFLPFVRMPIGARRHENMRIRVAEVRRKPANRVTTALGIKRLAVCPRCPGEIA